MKSSVKGFFCVVIFGTVLVQAQAKFPVKVDIDVSTKRQSKMVGAGDDGQAQVEQVQVRVKVRKAGGQAYTDPLTAELYVIGKQIHTGYFGVIDVQKGKFTFDAENDNSFEYKSPMYALGKTGGNINVGGVYETYLVVILNKDGEIIETRSGRSIGEKGIAFIRELGPKTLFDRDGNVIGKVDVKNSAFKKAIPTALESEDDD